jgi:hypothetical protein
MRAHRFPETDMTRRCIPTFAALALGAAAAFAALAQQPAAPPAPEAPAASSEPIPKHNCAKPDEFPGNLATDAQKRNWQKAYVGYVDCLKKFITEQQALAEPHVKASNAAIAEYNSGGKEYNAQVEKAKAN